MQNKLLASELMLQEIVLLTMWSFENIFKIYTSFLSVYSKLKIYLQNLK